MIDELYITGAGVVQVVVYQHLEEMMVFGL